MDPEDGKPLKKVPYYVSCQVKNISHMCEGFFFFPQAVSVDLIKDTITPYSCGLF